MKLARRLADLFSDAVLKEVLTVALVGYTNAGKTALANRLTQAGVSGKKELRERDLLFQTLDSTLRRFKLPSGRAAVIVDSVGFIRDLPHALFAAFEATLAELAAADILLHVRDASHPHFAQQKDVVTQTLRDAGVPEEDEDLFGTAGDDKSDEGGEVRESDDVVVALDDDGGVEVPPDPLLGPVPAAPEPVVEVGVEGYVTSTHPGHEDIVIGRVVTFQGMVTGYCHLGHGRCRKGRSLACPGRTEQYMAEWLARGRRLPREATKAEKEAESKRHRDEWRDPPPPH